MLQMQIKEIKSNKVAEEEETATKLLRTREAHSSSGSCVEKRRRHNSMQGMQPVQHWAAQPLPEMNDTRAECHCMRNSDGYTVSPKHACDLLVTPAMTQFMPTTEWYAMVAWTLV